MRISKRNIQAIIIFFIFYVLFGGYLYARQERIIYQPFSQDFNDCPGFILANKVTHNGTRMYVSDTDEKTVVFYHGNAGSACDRDIFADIITQAGYGYVMPEYAGFSNDDRQTTHKLVKQDVQNVISYLNEQDKSDIILVGESVGAAIASYHASLEDPNRMLLITPFKSLKDIAQRKFWFYPAGLLVDNAFDNSELLKNYQNSIIIIHGDADRIIPQESSRLLYELLATNHKSYISVEGYGHNNLFVSPVPYSVLVDFLEEKK